MPAKTDHPTTNTGSKLPLVSIVTIVYNGVHFLERTIRSVISQTYPNIEYIVIDGGSTDGTLEIIERYKDHIHHWVSEADKGISDAFNKGLSSCSGELIGFINADDWYETDAVEKVVERFGEGSVFYGNLQYWKGPLKDYEFKGNHRLLNLEMTVNHPTVFVKSSLYKQFGNFNLSYRCAMDYEFLLRLYRANVPFVYLDKVLTNMQLDGISDKQWKLGYREVKRAKDEQFGKSWKHLLWYRKQLATVTLNRLLKGIGLGFVSRYYRAYLAPVKKRIER